MNKFKFLLVATLLFSLATNAQTADEILENYFENTGGLENFKGIKMSAKVNQGGMEIPLEMYQI